MGRLSSDGHRAPWPVELSAPDLERWRAGNTGVPFFTALESGRPGPEVLVTAVVHGNEISGALVLDRALSRGLKPRSGRLTLGFCNVAAALMFDPEYPNLSRFVDEDLNRVWDRATLEGPRSSLELARARDMRPLIDRAQFLLDLHSMQNPVRPLMLAGACDKGLNLAQDVGYPATIVIDAGHAAGARLRDYAFFADPSDPRTALLLEAGQHWASDTFAVADEAFHRFLLAVGTLDPDDMPAAYRAPPAVQEVIQVTQAVTAKSGSFAFVDHFLGMERIEKAGTVIAHDHGQTIKTPYDDCVLIMPSRRLAKGQTAVRLGRIVDG